MTPYHKLTSVTPYHVNGYSETASAPILLLQKGHNDAPGPLRQWYRPTARSTAIQKSFQAVSAATCSNYPAVLWAATRQGTVALAQLALPAALRLVLPANFTPNLSFPHESKVVRRITLLKCSSRNDTALNVWQHDKRCFCESRHRFRIAIITGSPETGRLTTMTS